MQRREAQRLWEIESVKRDEARARRGLDFVPEEEVDEYNRILAEQRSMLSIPSAPAMPTCVHAMLGNAGGDSWPLDHQHNIAPSGY
eukprot:1454587-Karenia_brevis.AAC.1